MTQAAGRDVVSAWLVRAREVLRRLDPNDDPSAEPVSVFALAAVLTLAALSTAMFLRWKIQPMQDVGHHLAMTAIVADYNKAGSIYPAIYKPFDWLNTNSLLYTVAGLAGRVIAPSWAFRLTLATYLAGTPLASLWSLRVFGRSAWGAVIAVPLVYNISYVYGFANFLFAAPFAVAAPALFYRMLVRPTRGRVAATAACMVLLFLAHVHVFLWVGVLLFVMTLVAFVDATKQVVLGAPMRKPLTTAGVALASVVPSLALFARWYVRSTRPPPADEYAMFTATAAGTKFADIVAALKPPSQLFADLPAYLKLVRTEDDFVFFLALAAAWGVAVAISRVYAWRRPPVMELACALTLASYFCLPEHAAGQAVIASRQIGFGLWYAAAFFTPVPGRASRLGRFVVIGASLALALFQLGSWHRLLVKFEREEAFGLEQVLAAAPPRKRLHYVNIDPLSKYFNLNAFWHVEKWYMLDKAGQCNENPAFGVMNAIHYRANFQLHRVTHHANDWPSVDEIWQNFDLVLVHHWRPTERDLARAREKGERLAKQGEWELWQVRH